MKAVPYDYFYFRDNFYGVWPPGRNSFIIGKPGEAGTMDRFVAMGGR